MPRPSAKATELKLTRYFEPKVPKDLTPLQVKQLIAAGKLYFGTTSTAAVLMGPDGAGERSFYGCLEVREIARAGHPAYTSFFYMGDSGAVFAAGTTKVVAQIIQCGLECEDHGLHAALRAVLDEKPAAQPRPRPARRSAKKPAKARSAKSRGK